MRCLDEGRPKCKDEIQRKASVSLTGPDGLLKQLAKTVIETALNQELTEHLEHDKHGQPVGGTCGTGPGPRRC